ncbi:uncharacterized protein LOC126844872 [Adelges cooleyi]|uniref:uncharacterized protein LOC126844872 n=1 Tax=Adelges cooleyi TaxID=133065 RepID=UPI00217F74D5|nr:uncharacterized protein LOC126844872 [Adelges cooleyi]
MMNIKMYIIFCLTYYFPMVNSITPQEIENLWKRIKPEDSEYIVFNDLVMYYYPDIMNLYEVIIDHGIRHEIGAGEFEFRMSYEQFENAASKGLIPRWSKRVMYTEFKQMIPNGEDRNYINLDEMIKYYVPRYLRTVIELEKVMETYGVKNNDNQYHLYFYNFRIAMCIGDLPNPSFENGYA